MKPKEKKIVKSYRVNPVDYFKAEKKAKSAGTNISFLIAEYIAKLAKAA